MNLKRVELKEINWTLEKYGCGPTSLANVLVNLGFKINPIDTAKKILYDRNGNFDEQRYVPLFIENDKDNAN